MLPTIYLATDIIDERNTKMFALHIVTFHFLDDDWLGMWTSILHKLLDRIPYDENCGWRGQSNDWMSGKINMHTTLDRIHCFGNKWRLEIVPCDKYCISYRDLRVTFWLTMKRWWNCSGIQESNWNTSTSSRIVLSRCV